jgi:hypothetical protein
MRPNVKKKKNDASRKRRQRKTVFIGIKWYCYHYLLLAHGKLSTSEKKKRN